MISPLNFAASAVRDLRKLAGTPNWPDKSIMLSVAGCLEGAQHFQLPDGGRILNDKLKGLVGNDIRLPYPLVSVEYMVPREMHNLTEARPVICTKRIALAQEIRPGELDEFVSDLPDHERAKFVKGAIQVIVLNKIDTFEHWGLVDIGWAMPIDWFSGVTAENGEPSIAGYPYPLMPRRTEETIRFIMRKNGVDRRTAVLTMAQDVEDEISAVLALCEAFTCTNVGSTSIQTPSRVVNERRIRQGKTPLYEVKVLTVNVPGGKISGRSLGGTHESPRQHLRRGHIRRLESGKNTWVNSHLVGDPAKGRIDKIYDVKREVA